MQNAVQGLLTSVVLCRLPLPCLPQRSPDTHWAAYLAGCLLVLAREGPGAPAVAARLARSCTSLLVVGPPTAQQPIAHLLSSRNGFPVCKNVCMFTFHAQDATSISASLQQMPSPCPS